MGEWSVLLKNGDWVNFNNVTVDVKASGVLVLSRNSVIIRMFAADGWITARKEEE